MWRWGNLRWGFWSRREPGSNGGVLSAGPAGRRVALTNLSSTHQRAELYGAKDLLKPLDRRWYCEEVGRGHWTSGSLKLGPLSTGKVHSPGPLACLWTHWVTLGAHHWYECLPWPLATSSGPLPIRAAPGERERETPSLYLAPEGCHSKPAVLKQAYIRITHSQDDGDRLVGGGSWGKPWLSLSSQPDSWVVSLAVWPFVWSKTSWFKEAVPEKKKNL